MTADERFTDEALEEYLLALDEHRARLDDEFDDWPPPGEPGRIAWSRTRHSHMAVEDLPDISTYSA